MQVRSQLWEEPDEVQSRLVELGLTLSGMQDAVVAYRVGLSSATANDPPNAAGSFGYVFATRFLRDLLIPQGWRKCDAGGYCRVLHDERRIAIAVSTGDENTGRTGGDAPRTKRSKGPRTAAAIADNIQQLWLFGDAVGEAPSVGPIAGPTSGPVLDSDGVALAANAADGFVTWLLLMHATPTEIFSELSLPVELDDTARPGQWRERIVLPPAAFDGPSLPPLGLPEPGPDFDVSVIRRVG